LKEEQAATYRVWLMCRHLDSSGRGWLDIQTIRQHLTVKESERRLFGWRRLRQIIGQGHGRFWNWDKQNGRLWLYGAARVAANLNVTRLTGKPVVLPDKAITSSMGEFKAHLYAAWHSGRKHNNPISRQTQATITSIPKRTQRHYCQVAGVERQSNIAIGGHYNPDSAKEAAWQRGRAVFEFVDTKGQQGKKNGRYLAWHLPNTYSSPHQQAAKGRMKKINRRLKDLVNKGTQGNEQKKIDKLYHANGADAAKVINRDKTTEAYWALNHEIRNFTLWHVFCVQ
jgi:hypothetical protein